MPYSNGARIEIINECNSAETELYYYIDYEEYNNNLEYKLGRFHAQWREQNPCDGIIQKREISNEEFLSHGGKFFSKIKI